MAGRDVVGERGIRIAARGICIAARGIRIAARGIRIGARGTCHARRAGSRRTGQRAAIVRPVIPYWSGGRFYLPDGTPLPDHVKTMDAALSEQARLRPHSVKVVHDDRAPEHMLGWLLLLVAGVAVLLGGYWALRSMRAIEARTAAVEAREALRAAEEARAADAIASLRDCRSPQRNGDRAVITVWRQGDRLIARCAYLVDPADPARALKESRP